MANFENLAAEMAKAYTKTDITMISSLSLPDKDEIISIINDIQGLFFPAFFSRNFWRNDFIANVFPNSCFYCHTPSFFTNFRLTNIL